MKHPKVGSALDDLIARVQAGEVSAEDAAREAPLHRGDSIGVAIHLSGNVDGVVRFLEANGASNISARDDYIEAYVPVLLLAETSEQPGVIRLRPIQPPEESQGGSGVPGNGPAVHGSTAWNQAGYTGSGIKLGVIDSGFDGLMGTEAPANVQVRCYRGLGEHSQDMNDCGGGSHGTVVAESVMDIAPGASLYISDPQSPGDLGDAVDWMISEGVSVINHSRTWLFDGPGDGTSPSSVSPLNTVDRAVAAGIVWVNAAGNSAQRTWFQRGPFSYNTISVDGEDVRVINFEASNFKNRFHLWGSLQLRWDDTWGGATRDLDLLLVTPDSGDIALASIDPQSGWDGHFPYERVSSGATFDVMIANRGGSEPSWIQLLAWSGQGLRFKTPESGSITNPAESANPGMLTVGAAHWSNVSSIESYSSRGPTPDGRLKPDLVGADCGQTAANSGPFCGTSQASPHVAGMAALVRQRFPGYSPAQVVSYLKENAEQRISSPDPNNTWGHGFMVLPPLSPQPIDSPSIQSITPAANSLTVEWIGPSSDGGSAITAYDLRHIETSSDETVDANWTVVEDVWTSGSGQLRYELTGLGGGTPYDVQMRSVGSAGDGPWSTAASATTGAASAPDLVVNVPTVSESAPAAGATFTLSATVRNQGNGRSDSTTLRYYQSTDSTITTGDTEVGTDSVSGLDASDSGDESVSLDVPSTSGTYYYGACVEAVSGESNTTNNCSAAVAVTVGAGPAPDLVVDTPTVDTSAPVAGSRFTLSATVRNQGSGRSDSTTLRYYQSADSTITTDDTEVGTDSVFRLDASSNGDESISLTAPSTAGTYYYGACVDAVSEGSDTTNNCSAAVTVTVGAASAPDLVVNVPTVSESAPAAGARFTLSAAVRNQGNGRSGSTTLRYYQSTDPTITTGDTEVGTDSVSGLDASDSGDEWTSLDAPPTPSTYYYGACVDAVTGESDTTNNCSLAATVTVGSAPAPDLVVDTPTVSESAPAAGVRITLSATVRNQGSGRSDSTTLRYYQSTDSTITTGDTEVGTDSVSGLDASESGDESISLTAPSSAGTYYYGACVEAVSDESDTTNNCLAAVTVTVGAAPAPDLVVDTPTVDTSAPAAGARFTLSATVRNQGSGRSDSTTLRYYRSTDSTITTGDTEVGTDSVFRLDASESGDESIGLTAPSSAGTYYYGACVDSVSGESGTTNNCSLSVVVAVDVAPDNPANQRYSWQGATTVVSWDASPAAEYYNVYHDDFFDSNCRLSSSGGPSFCDEVATNVIGTSYTHTSPDDDTNYYWITACNSAGCSNIDSNNPARMGGSAPAPDLVVDTPTVSEGAPAAGVRFTLSATVLNQGNGRSDSTTLRYYQSSDSSIAVGDTEVGTDSVFRLDASESGDESIGLTAPSSAGTYYYGACVEAVSDESDTTNNCSPAVTVTVGAVPAPDLVVDTPTVSESAPAAGDRFTLSAKVRNQGNGPSAFTTLRYYQSSDSTITTGDTEVGTDSVFGLAASRSGDESVSLTAASTPGTYYFGACADLVSDESDTTNNCSAAVTVTVTVGTAPAPDLVVDTPTVSESAPTAGASFTLSATVRNQGNGRSDSTTLRYYQSTDSTITTGDTEVGTDSVFRLDASSSGDESISLTAPSSAGTYYYGACVDSLSDESDTTNNCSPAVTVTVGATPAPDLIVSTFIVSNNNPVPGQYFTMNITVNNQGNGVSSSTRLRYFRSSDATITTDDATIPTSGRPGFFSVDGLNPSGSVDKSASTSAPPALGTYYYGACVEPVTGESDATNNCSRAATVTVDRTNQPPQLTGDVDDIIVKLGNSFTVDISGLFTDPDGDEITSYGFAFRTSGILSGIVYTKTGILSLRAIAVGETIVAVDARDSNGASRASEDLFKVTVTAAETLDEPGAPTGLTATADGQTEIDLSWTAPSDNGGADITGYKIEVSTDGSSWSDLAADTRSTTTSYSHTSLTEGTTRHYRVSAINSAGTGPASSSDSATTDEEPVSDGTCTVDLIVEPGESCIYPGTSAEFSVDSDGTGRFLIVSSGSGIELRSTDINGVTYTFVASRQSDGNWLVEEVG